MTEKPVKPKPMKECTSCGTEIPKAAIVCKQCRNYQGRWWWWRTAGVGLPWIVAVVSVTSLLYQNVSEKLPTVAKDANISIVGVNEAGNLDVSFTNTGKQALIVEGSAFAACDYTKVGQSDYTHQHFSRIVVKGNRDVLPANGVNLVVFEISPELVAYLKSKTDADCKVGINFVDGRGGSALKMTQIDLLKQIMITKNSSK